MLSISTSIFAFRYLSISVLLKNEEKHINVLERKIIRTGCNKIIDSHMSFAEKLILYFQKRFFCLNHMSV